MTKLNIHSNVSCRLFKSNYCKSRETREEKKKLRKFSLPDLFQIFFAPNFTLKIFFLFFVGRFVGGKHFQQNSFVCVFFRQMPQKNSVINQKQSSNAISSSVEKIILFQ